jgi:alanyl aminopeptidase
VRIVTPRGKEAWARYAAESTAPILRLLEKYFGEPYPYPKLDMIAVPMFGGAMENPGLVTFRQGAILSRPGTESTGWRRGYAATTAHELAHSWFGDLVTTAWWDDLWLNEAFATWMTPKIIDQFRPEWNVPSSRVVSASGAMRADSLTSARKIRQPIDSDDDIKNAFDSITYQKGAAVIAMFERWIGVDKFQRGVQRYMREHGHRTATATDLLAAVSAEAGRDIAPAFSTFLDRAGVPLVGAALKCDAKGARLAMAQSRYLPLGSASGSEGAPAQAPWQIPVCARFASAPGPQTACTLLDKEQGELALPACPDWILPNDAASGYYRTGYDEGTLARLAKNLGSLTAQEKIVTVGDLGALARAGKLGYDALLALVPQLAKDKDAHVVDAAAGVTGGLRDFPLVDEEARPSYARFVQNAFGARARALGLHSKPGEDEETRWLRPTLIELVADQGEDAGLRAECTKLARAWLKDKDAVEPELVGTVLGVAAAFGDRALFDAFVAEAKETPERADRDRLIVALGQFRAPELVTAALFVTLGDDFDPRESIRILWTETRVPNGAKAAYRFMTDHFDALAQRLPRDWGAGAPGIGAALCDDGRRADVESFFKDRTPKFTGGPRVLAQSLEGMRICSAFRSGQAAKVKAFLMARK